VSRPPSRCRARSRARLRAVLWRIVNNHACDWSGLSGQPTGRPSDTFPAPDLGVGHTRAAAAPCDRGCRPKPALQPERGPGARDRIRRRWVGLLLRMMRAPET
jgi:hypothetical protein